MQVNAGSIAPITAVQFGANRFYELTLKSITGKDSSQAGQIAIALAAGSTSSLISTPAELIMIQQGRNQRALMTEARSYIRRHGLTALYRGFVSLFTMHNTAYAQAAQAQAYLYRHSTASRLVVARPLYKSKLVMCVQSCNGWTSRA